MITLVTDQGVEHTIVSDKFPDKTSQVWKLKDDVFRSHNIEITWHFEDEREIIDLLSLRKLLPAPAYNWELHIPFMPYGRQDKAVSNTSTFNLRVIADLINTLSCSEVTSVDVHNTLETGALIRNFKNIPVTELHKMLVKETQPDYLVYPDLGARNRYYTTDFASIPRIIFYKERNQQTGEITSHTMSYRDAHGITVQNANLNEIAQRGQRFLIVDDLCDGGATFISIAEKIRSQVASATIDLYVTHGVFSKGRAHVTQSGLIDNLYTTNSLTKNGDGFKV